MCGGEIQLINLQLHGRGIYQLNGMLYLPVMMLSKLEPNEISHSQSYNLE